MDTLVQCACDLVEARADAAAAAETCKSADVQCYPKSVRKHGAATLFLAHRGDEKMLVVASSGGAPQLQPPDVAEKRMVDTDSGALAVLACPCSNANALYLQEQLDHLKPTTNPGTSAFGAGDRLGLSTPGHVRALAGSGYFPLFAQQSIREMDRTCRTPEDVMATAVWGVIEEGFSAPWGSDADHLKTDEDIERVAPYRYTMFTLDPSDLIVDPDALSPDELRAAYERLPWDVLDASPDKLVAEYGAVRKAFADPGGTNTTELAFDEASVVHSAVKYSAGIARCARLERLLRARHGADLDLEVSFDETDWPTSPLEHLFIASEFKRLGMRVDSLALRFPGAFEKGIDYKGDLAVFEGTFAVHAAIRDAFDMYRLSIHSGSDKFTVYPIMSKYAAGKLHVKTAGTTYLEALRVAARKDTALFGEILEFSYGRYDEDKRTYHVSADTARMPKPETIPADAYAPLLDDDAWRQVLHVGFGSVLTSTEHDFRARLCAMLAANEEDFYTTVEKHFRKHLSALEAGL